MIDDSLETLHGEHARIEGPKVNRASNRSYGRRAGEDAFLAFPDNVILLHSCDLSADDGQCVACGKRDCPHGEPRHYHINGCPQCNPETATLQPYKRGLTNR